MKKIGLGLFLAVLAVLSGCSSGGSSAAKIAIMSTSASLPAGSISSGAAYPSTTLAASGGTAPYTWSVTSGNLPTGLVLSSGGAISGAATASGAFSFTVTVTDSAIPAHTAAASLSITINGKLTITSSGALTPIGTAGSAYSSALATTGGVGPFVWALNSGTLPTGLNLSGTGTVSGTISSSAAAGTYNFTAKVTDSQGGSGTSGTITITVDPAMAITAPSLSIGAVGVNYAALAFSASGGSGTGYSFTIASGTLPAPLTLGATSGLISAGPPTAAGTYPFTVKVTDSVGNTATTGTLSITINPAISVTLSPTGPVTLDQTKTQLVTAAVNNDPAPAAGVTWSTITGLGSLSGLTTTAATYSAPATVAVASTATFTATSITDPTKSKTFTVNLVPPPQITTTTMAAGNVNGVYSSSVSMSGGVAPYTWALVTAPAGISLGSSTTNTVTVQGTPTTAGANQTFTVKVTDAQGLSATSSGLTISVYATLVLTPPTVPLPTGNAGINYPTAETFTASGGSGTGYTWSVSAGNLPTGLSLSAATGTTTSITAGPPTTAGTYPFTVKLIDSVGNIATTSGLSITINPPINVTFSPSSLLAMDQNTSLLITATANNDSKNAGVSWSGVSGLGSLTGATTTTITYNAPATVSAASIATFTATSVTDPTKSSTFTVNLVPPPAIATPTFPGGTVGTSYSSVVTEAGGVGPFVWTPIALPAGLSLSASTGSSVTVQGTPTTAGASQAATIRVTDAKGLTNTISSTITVTAPSCTSGCTISGTVVGPWVSNVTIAISGGGSPTTTDASGNYSFTGLAGGSYTITPSLAGYTYSPTAPSVATSSTTTTQNFVATSVMASYSISGTISYAGAKTGNTIIRVFQNGCTNCGTIAGTSFSSAPSAAGTSYVIRGLQPTNGGGGPVSYVVTAQIDTMGTAIENESNPEGTSNTVTLPSANAVGINISVVDRIPPSAPSTPKQITVAPGDTVAVVQYKDEEDNNGEEIPTSYKVYYGTDTNASNGATSPLTFKAQGHGTDLFILKGLANGLTYFKLTALNGDGESAATTPVSVTLGTATGLNTISGTVTFPGTATGPMYVGVYGNSGVYVQAIASPHSPQAYSFAGVPNGTYQNFAIIDMNNDGQVGPGDIDNVKDNSNTPTLVVTGNTTGDLTLTSPNTNLTVPTTVQGVGGQPNSYSISVRMDSAAKLPISAVLFSGPNVAVPYDMNDDQHNGGYNPIYNNSVSPTVGDTYQFLVTFSDGTTQVVPGVVDAVLTSFAQNLAINSPLSSGSTTVPELNWAAPTTPPTFLPYTYNVNLYNQNGTSQEFWSYYGSGSGNGLPSTQTSVLFNVDGSASPSASLTSGGTYGWSVEVQDSHQNTARYTAVPYTVP
jgi:hypothetical protein